MRICVVGGGAAGCMAAITAARLGAEVILLEKNEKIGKKIYITGKGRCNVTNDCDVQDFLKNVVNGEKFLRSSLYNFSPSDTKYFFENAGTPLVTERGNRVFPASMKSSDIIKALSASLKEAGVELKLNCEVKSVKFQRLNENFGNSDADNAANNNVSLEAQKSKISDAADFGGSDFSSEELSCADKFEIHTSLESFTADKLIIATGGISYPSTGSTGDGYRFAKGAGHTVVSPRPALAPVLLKNDVSSLEGISLKNVRLTAMAGGKIIKDCFGELLFTKKGVSGPVALTLSSYINRFENVSLYLDLKPALDSDTLEKRIIRDFTERSKQELKNVTRALLPERLNTYVLKSAGLDAVKTANSVTKEERGRLVRTLKNLKFDVLSTASWEEAVVTSGGVNLNELKPDLESRLINGLYFAGEVIDADALTGGFNLQIAFSTGARAAVAAVGKA